MPEHTPCRLRQGKVLNSSHTKAGDFERISPGNKGCCAYIRSVTHVPIAVSQRGINPPLSSTTILSMSPFLRAWTRNGYSRNSCLLRLYGQVWRSNSHKFSYL